MNRKATIIAILICLGAAGLLYAGYTAESERAFTGSGQTESPGENAKLTAASGAALISGTVGTSTLSPNVVKGASLYAAHCASCHGVNLEGETDWQTPHPDGRMKAPPHDDTGHTWHHDDNMLYEYTRVGGQALMRQAGIDNFQSGMPAFGNVLTDEEIVLVFDFIKSRWSTKNRRIQRQRSGN